MTGVGFDDVLVGMPSQDPRHPAWWLSSAKVLDGRTGIRPDELTETTRGRGEGVTGAGDVDLDTWPD